LEDLVHRLRLSENASKMLPATPHSLIRTFLATEHTDALLRVLNDRLNYGVFPDHYTANLLMDTFLKKKLFLGIIFKYYEKYSH
jgi:small subunit ribosomal protein S27